MKSRCLVEAEGLAAKSADKPLPFLSLFLLFFAVVFRVVSAVVSANVSAVFF